MKLGHVIVPVDDMDAATAFYVDRLGLDLRFRDVERYAAVSDGSVALGLAAPEEQPAAGQIALSVQVDSLAEFLAGWTADGLAAGEVTEGGHERRVTLQDPFGNSIVVYERHS